MNDFTSALAESFAVTPARTTDLVIDTFDSAGRSDDPVRPSVSPCIAGGTEPVRASICRGAEHEPVRASICRVVSTVA